jgi:hypothetical protein
MANLGMGRPQCNGLTLCPYAAVRRGEPGQEPGWGTAVDLFAQALQDWSRMVVSSVPPSLHFPRRMEQKNAPLPAQEGTVDAFSYRLMQ